MNAEEEKKGGDEEEVFDILLTHQAVVKKEVLTDNLVLKLVTVTGEVPLQAEYETVQEPKPEMVLQAKLEFQKKRVFDFVQELQKKGQEDRKKIYAKIKQIDEQMEQDQTIIRQVKDKDTRTRFMDTMIQFKK